MKSNRQLSSAFQHIFYTVVALTLLSGTGSIALALQSNPTPQQNRIFEICNTTWNMGIGAIFGLLGATEPTKAEQENDKADQ